jgi:hypothetical protein
MVALIVQDVGGQKGHGRMPDVLAAKRYHEAQPTSANPQAARRRGAGLSFAPLVHDRHGQLLANSVIVPSTI